MTNPKLYEATMLDAFAGDALNGLYSNHRLLAEFAKEPSDKILKTIAADVYEMAAAMLEERKKYIKE